MMPLLMANAGEENIIKKIGGLPEMKKHLSDLGFVVGGTVTVVTSMAGNVIVNVKDTRVALVNRRQSSASPAMPFGSISSNDEYV